MEELRLNIIDLCNQSQLPLEAIYFVVKDVWRDVENTLQRYKESQNQPNSGSGEKEK